jgi:hypothetical protein
MAAKAALMRAFPFFMFLLGKRVFGTVVGKSNLLVVVLKTAFPKLSRRARIETFPAML